MDKPLLSLNDVSKTFVIRSQFKKQRRTIIEGVSFDLHKGESIGIIGRNGSGKSTLLKIISGILKPDKGTVICNSDIVSILELGMGFQPDLTGIENIYLKAQMYGFTKRECAQLLPDIVDYSELGDYINYPVKTYSSGMLGRLAFSIMINLQSEVMIVDEVLSTGDLAFGLKSEQHFKKMRAKGHAFIIVSHSLSTIREMCDKVIWLDKGKVVEAGDSKVVCGHYEKEMKESYTMIKSLAENGVPYALNQLGIFYRDGVNVPQDLEKAIFYFDKASNALPEAATNLANIYSEHYPSETEKIIKIYERAAKLGSEEAKLKISKIKAGKKTDCLQDNLKRLASYGDPIDQYNYAKYLLNINENTDSVKEAIFLMKSSAMAGYPQAQYHLGTLHLNGIGCERNIQLAIELLKQSAYSGNISAQIILGNLYWDGVDVDYDYAESIKWFLMSALQGDPESQFKVAEYYKNIDSSISNHWYGVYSHRDTIHDELNLAHSLLINGDKANLDFAFSIYLELANLDNSEAMLQLALLYRDKPEYNNPEKYLYYLEKSANHYNLVANLLLGINYRMVGKTMEAIKCLELVANSGDRGARFELAQLYLDNPSISEGCKKGIFYLKLASRQGDTRAQNMIKDVYKYDKTLKECRDRWINGEIIALDEYVVITISNDIVTIQKDLGTSIIVDTPYHELNFNNNQLIVKKNSGGIEIIINGASTVYNSNCKDNIILINMQ